MNRASNGSSHFWEDRIIIAGLPTESPESRIVLGIGLRLLRDAGESPGVGSRCLPLSLQEEPWLPGCQELLAPLALSNRVLTCFQSPGYLTSGRFHDHCRINEEIGRVFSDWSPQVQKEISELRTIQNDKRKKILSILREFQYTAVAIPTAVRRKYRRARARFERSGLCFTKVKMHSETCKKPCGLFGH